MGVDVISGGAVGIALGVLGYFFGAGRLGVATVLVCVLAMLAGLLVNQTIPGAGDDDRELPVNETAADDG